jgi:hypothetical protein
MSHALIEAGLWHIPEMVAHGRKQITGAMSQTGQYQQYTIKSSPEQSLNGGQWRLKISIFWEENGATTFKPFSAETTYRTESEADIHGVTYGQRIIDGKIPGVSVK